MIAFTTGLLVLTAARPTPARAQGAKSGASARSADTGSAGVERGKYIVEHLAKCSRCHTPGNVAGEHDGDHLNWLLGGPLQFQPTYPIANWALVAPRLAGAPPGDDASVIRLLTTGISRTGAPPKPPMPNFGMSQSDAASVVAYLKSLPK